MALLPSAGVPRSSSMPKRARRTLTGLGVFGATGPVSLALQLVRALVLLALLVFFGLPMLWLLLAPSKTNVQLANLAPISFGRFYNYWAALQHLLHYDSGIYVTWIVNSIFYVGVTVVLAVALSLTAGYALAMFQFPGRHAILVITLVALITPSAAIVLPLFLEMNLFHLLNTAWSVILPSSFFPFGVYLSYVYFSTSLPPAVIEAARMDGGSEARIFRSVAMPLAKPLVSLVAFFAFVGQWNNFYLVQVMIASTNRFNLQTGLATILASAFYSSPFSPPGILRPELALGGILLAAPVIIFFFAIQRYLMRGLLAGYGVG
jgi:multiple sugar transport system permease protein